MKISLILADDHPAILEGISVHLGKDERFQIIGTMSNGLDLLASTVLSAADVILLDLNMPGLDGLRTLEALHKRSIKAKIIIMTYYNSQELMKDCRLKGASGYIVKSAKLTHLADTILSVIAGKTAFPTQEKAAANDLVFSYFDDFLKKHKLTKREVEIIRLVCQNLRTRDIAERLYLSEFTIHTHRKNIMRKLELADSTVALYDFAIRNNLITGQA